MEEPANTSMEVPQDEKTRERKGIGRRRLLKTLIASGGVVALTGLPNKWAKPVVEAGELSAHAQASPTGDYRIANLIIDENSADGVDGQSPVGHAHFTYYDSAKLVAEVAGTMVEGRTNCSPLFPAIAAINPWYAAKGTVEFIFDIPTCNATTLYAKLKSAGRTSNEISAPLLINSTTNF